jgi:serine/threonine protein kinase
MLLVRKRMKHIEKKFANAATTAENAQNADNSVRNSKVRSLDHQFTYSIISRCLSLDPDERPEA